ncbi:MAG: RNA polymerase sigma-54 factor [Deltaproteobacteria bacterium RBG_13_49_15]|nr:MAG: RNA polymerase sigma-54 factor [Deltaproteobacteria bacterium RBG_13_49_15]
MSLKLNQQLKLTQQLIMTPQLQMAIRLLQLSHLELEDAIRQELEENPALEETQEDVPAQSTDEEEGPVTEEPQKTKEITIEERIRDDIDWSNYIEEYNAPGQTYFETERKESVNFDSFVAQKGSLKDHLLWQLLMMFSSKEDRKVGSLIIGNLNKDGYLELTVEELIQTSGAAPERVGYILSQMQTFDPVGVCARDLKECLLIQVARLGLDNTIVADIIRDHLNHLQNKNYKAICRTLKAGMADVISAVKVIQRLEPKPGRQFNEEEPRYIVPDIYVYKMDNDFVIMLNDDGLPKLRINSYYKSAMIRREPINDKEKEYLKDRLRSATWLIRSIHQRQKTIYRVMKSILDFQREFFEKGALHLKPMILRDVAQDIGMHESTVSRVTTNKYAYTPQGLFELKYFFNSSISRFQGEAIASASVQEKIRQIIGSEIPGRPCSDSKIVEMLKASNINIARRTVAKYREMKNILSSSKRKRV